MELPARNFCPSEPTQRVATAIGARRRQSLQHRSALNGSLADQIVRNAHAHARGFREIWFHAVASGV